MAKRRKKTKTKHLVGRDPTMGIPSFKTGAILNKKDRLNKRNSKAAKKKLREDLES